MAAGTRGLVAILVITALMGVIPWLEFANERGQVAAAGATHLQLASYK